MSLLNFLPFLFEIGNHLFLFRELVLDKGAESMSLPLEAPLQLDKALLVLDVERLPEQVCYQGIHEACLILEVGRESPELPVDIYHLIINKIESTPTQAVIATI